MLAPDIVNVIMVARKVYQEIHTKIRDADYDVFHGKLKVPFSKKLRIASRFVGVQTPKNTFFLYYIIGNFRTKNLKLLFGRSRIRLFLFMDKVLGTERVYELKILAISGHI